MRLALFPALFLLSLASVHCTGEDFAEVPAGSGGTLSGGQGGATAGMSNGGMSNGGTSNGGTSNGGTSNGGTSNGGTAQGGSGPEGGQGGAAAGAAQGGAGAGGESGSSGQGAGVGGQGEAGQAAGSGGGGESGQAQGGAAGTSGAAGAGGQVPPQCLPGEHYCPDQASCFDDADASACGDTCRVCPSGALCQGGKCKCPSGFVEAGGQCREFGGWFAEGSPAMGCNPLAPAQACACPEGFIPHTSKALPPDDQDHVFCVASDKPLGGWGGYYIEGALNKCVEGNTYQGGGCTCPAGMGTYTIELAQTDPNDPLIRRRFLSLCLNFKADGGTLRYLFAKFDQLKKMHATNGQNCFFSPSKDVCECPDATQPLTLRTMAPAKEMLGESVAPAQVVLCVEPIP